ncbi:MAG: alcohol dehydrogenase catalytic domain-containing protein [Chloroflexi bacterium]|nr:alcohol dehydrogenase catalytic domain-containing protein [Chloroflexota bacterium]MCY4247441.1 alcohol dehydrogenase catalytic domain-containing protein [Chloroflexota bacterium]
MQVARLYGPRDIRIADEPPPLRPARGEVRLHVGTVGLCGSDLHLYETGRIGYTNASSPFVLGHEFMGVVDALGDEALDGLHEPLQVGQRVAVDPAVPCWRCELCEQGHPNLCPHHSFYGLYPEDGALRDYMTVSARNCFPMPDSLSDASGPLLETLGVAIHALDLAKLRIGHSVAVLGAGPVGLLIARLAVLAGADSVIVSDKFGWRLQKARAWGAGHTLNVDEVDAVAAVAELTRGRGVDVAIEAAWADQSVQQAVAMARYGGRLVLVGIPPDDKLRIQHSAARRKGLTIMMSRRMKHTYPRAIQLAASGKVALDELVSHRFPLAQTADAYARNAAYAPGVNKVILQVGS